MANVREGITIEGEPANAFDDFDVALAAQIGKTRSVGTPPVDAARQVAASGDEIRERIAAPTLTTRVADGLEVRDPIAEREAREAADAARSSEHKTVVLAKILGEQAQRAEVAEAELAVRAFHDRLYEAEDRADVVSALAELRAVSPHAYEAKLGQMTDLYSLFDLEDEYIFADVETDEEADAVARTKLNGEVAWKLESDYAEAKTFVDGVNAQLSEEAALTDRQERVRRWQIENKLTKADATQRYTLAREIGLDAGFDLERLSGEQFDDMLRGAVATLDGLVSAERQRVFKQRLMDSPGGGIHDGIEIFTATGQWVRPNAVHVEAKPLTPEQIERTARGNRRATAAEIRSAFLDRADDDEADGWKSLQQRAGDLFEAAAPKPQRGGSI